MVTGAEALYRGDIDIGWFIGQDIRCIGAAVLGGSVGVYDIQTEDPGGASWDWGFGDAVEGDGFAYSDHVIGLDYKQASGFQHSCDEWWDIDGHLSQACALGLGWLGGVADVGGAADHGEQQGEDDDRVFHRGSPFVCVVSLYHGF